MHVDKERAAKVIEYMKKTNESWLSSGVQSVSALSIDPRARFSFQKFLHEHKLLENPMMKNDDIWIECPFHEDASPSCSINEHKYVYHCFSCGSRGNLINLIADYKSRYENSSMGYYQILNSFLISDNLMCAELGFSSIYSNSSEDNFNFEESLKQFHFIPPVGKVLPSSYSELADWMIKNRCSLEQIKLFIILMQEHLSTQEIYAEIISTNSANVVSAANNEEESPSISLNELLEF